VSNVVSANQKHIWGSEFFKEAGQHCFDKILWWITSVPAEFSDGITDYRAWTLSTITSCYHRVVSEVEM
jgi:hypothetical protein